MKSADYSKDLYDYTYECRRNCSAYDDGYNQGRADRDKEIAEHSVFFSNKPIEDIVLDARTDEREKTVRFIIDEFNRRTVCLGRATAKTYVINTLNEILKELKEQKNEIEKK